MALLTLPSGMKYHKIGNGLNVMVYMHGYTEDPLRSTFYTRFYPYIQDKVTLYMGIIPGIAGWEKPFGGSPYIGEYFLNFVISENPGKRIFVTGFSAGADPDYIFNVKGVTAFASVAGKSDSNDRLKTWAKTGIPVYAFTGTRDTSANKYELVFNTWKGKFEPAGGNLTWQIFDAADHPGVAYRAYTPSTGLWEWFDKQGIITPEPEITLDLPFKVKEGKVYAVGSDGKTYTWSLT